VRGVTEVRLPVHVGLNALSRSIGYRPFAVGEMCGKYENQSVTAYEHLEGNCRRHDALHRSRCTVLHRTCRLQATETRDEHLPYDLKKRMNQPARIMIYVTERNSQSREELYSLFENIANY